MAPWYVYKPHLPSSPAGLTPTYEDPPGHNRSKQLSIQMLEESMYAEEDIKGHAPSFTRQLMPHTHDLCLTF